MPLPLVQEPRANVMRTLGHFKDNKTPPAKAAEMLVQIPHLLGSRVTLRVEAYE